MPRDTIYPFFEDTVSVTAGTAGGGYTFTEFQTPIDVRTIENAWIKFDVEGVGAGGTMDILFGFHEAIASGAPSEETDYNALDWREDTAANDVIYLDAVTTTDGTSWKHVNLWGIDLMRIQALGNSGASPATFNAFLKYGLAMRH